MREVFFDPDTVVSPPLQEPLRGAEEVIAYFQALRPVLGRFQEGLEPHRVIRTKTMTSLMGNYALENGTPFVSVESFRRQADGSYRHVMGQFVMRGPLTATGASAETGGGAPCKGLDALACHKSFVELWNSKRYGDIRNFYGTDALLAPPNHEPIRGNDQITGFFERVRPLFGELQTGHEPYAVVATGELTSVMGNYVFDSGVRITTHEIYQRDGDGSYRDVLEVFGPGSPAP